MTLVMHRNACSGARRARAILRYTQVEVKTIAVRADLLRDENIVCLAQRVECPWPMTSKFFFFIIYSVVISIKRRALHLPHLCSLLMSAVTHIYFRQVPYNITIFRIETY